MDTQPANQNQKIIAQMAQIADQMIPIAFALSPAVSCVYRPWICLSDGLSIQNKSGVLISVNCTHAPDYVLSAIDELEAALIRWKQEEGRQARY
jgi:hypothetical protein